MTRAMEGLHYQSLLRRALSLVSVLAMVAALLVGMPESARGVTSPVVTTTGGSTSFTEDGGIAALIAHSAQQAGVNEDDFKDEFSHTILHNQNVFDEFKAIQAKKKAEEAKKEQSKLEAEAKAAADQMSAMKLDGYKPKYGQEPEMFNNMYMQFAQGIYQPVDEKSSAGTPSERPYSQ